MSAMAHEPAVILIIDNDPIMLTGIAAILSMSGYECHCARNSVSATKAAKSLALDLIICDVELGSENGLDVCGQLREQPGMEDVPMMFISSAQSPDIVRRSHAAGGAYYLRKPFDTEVLLELVSKALWMPHLIHSHTSAMPQPAAEPVQTSSAVPRSNIRHALSGIRMPLA
ncbi:PleD family two-component system response regulator [Anatilimnocola sp. NA78]|uniref:response regulator n=1 Tax=Anatilimnocola sp. NA78 TaxID=3415683 RepID=UPI003CE527B0